MGESAGYVSLPLPKSEPESFQWDFNKNEADAGSGIRCGGVDRALGLSVWTPGIEPFGSGWA